MPKPKLDDIEIVEPPIEELSKKRGGFLKACFTSCLLLVLVVVLAIVGLRLSMGAGPKTLKNVPANFPTDIPIYDRDNVNNITFISGKYKTRGIAIASVFPKLILSPIVSKFNPGASTTTAEQGSFKNLWKVITTPETDIHDTVQIEWDNLDTSNSFFVSYYKSELKKKQFTIDVESEGQGVRQFSFTHSADGTSGSVYARASSTDKNRTEYALLTVNLPTPTTTATTAP